MTAVKPPALRPGDTVGIVAPASSVKPDLLSAGCREIESLGFKVRYRDDILSSFRYLAGDQERRVTEFREMLEDPDVRAIFCARGGYGSGHLLSHIAPADIRAHPKIFCGASDITMLLNSYLGAGVVAFHGPMVATTMRLGVGGYDRDLLLRTLVGAEAVRFPTEGTEILNRGRAEGRLTGGCLSLLVSTMGTPWDIDTSDSILILEDIDCRPYQIDRMLTQLKQAGKFDSVRAIVFGEMVQCEQHPQQGYSLQEVVSDLLRDLNVPILYGFATGHTSRPNLIVPFGVRARITLDETSVFELMEPAVEPA